MKEKASSVSLKTERTRMDKMKDDDLNVHNKPASPALEAPTISPLNDFKYNPSEEEEVTYTVIDQFQQKFGAAMLHIKKQSVLSVAAEGANVCRHGKLCWLQVIHDCHWLSDCLSHQYGVLLNDVFDTQVADVLQFSMETGGFLPNCISTLQESLVRHLKVAPKCISFLEERQKLIGENPEVWFTRPLSPTLLKILALEATYLLPLCLVLLDEMMSDLTTLVDGYLNTYREESAERFGGTEPALAALALRILLPLGGWNGLSAGRSLESGEVGVGGTAAAAEFSWTPILVLLSTPTPGHRVASSAGLLQAGRPLRPAFVCIPGACVSPTAGVSPRPAGQALS
ncbi:piRNA biogenesis protein EXD1-like [Tamandua tetradactyla]|uniref:piRNA biogenesis protein EXD1-like n=1 Tax=Tamandua tetradactyla TaxID=48850 RepID=UPI004053E14C